MKSYRWQRPELPANARTNLHMLGFVILAFGILGVLFGFTSQPYPTPIAIYLGAGLTSFGVLTLLTSVIVTELRRRAFEAAIANGQAETYEHR